MQDFLHYLLCVCALLSFRNEVGVFAENAWAQGDNLMGFWPLSNFHKVTDISGNKQDGTALTDAMASSLAGPFGDPLTSYSSKSTRAYGGVFEIKSPKTAQKLSLNGLASFTVSFFLKTAPGGQKGGFLQFLTAEGSSNNKPLHIYIDSGKICLSGNAVACSYINDVINYNAWNYFALTFTAKATSTGKNCSLSLYSRYGQLTQPRVYDFICAAQSQSVGGIRLGGTVTGSTWNPNFLVSCLMLYKTALTEQDILQNYEACRVALSGTPCGTPRLPISQPQVPVAAAKAGQFPWLASLHYRSNNKMVCSVTIVNAYWALTAESCFSVSSQPSNYYVNVGKFDVAVVESHERKHNVRSIVFKQASYQELYDVALVELATPIDFGNAYANEACIPIDDWFFQPETATSFIIGWGENGRDATTSLTVLRYGSGSVVSNQTCAKSWSVDDPKAEPLLCFRGDPDATLPCKGDAGSPLGVLVDGSKLVQVGIYSTRNADCTSTSSKLPLFSRVAKFWPWIKSTIGCVNPGQNYPIECPMV